MRNPEVKVERVPLASLKAYDGNAKKHDQANVDAIAESIKEFGFRNPILAWHNEDGVPEIVAGHGRAAAAKKLRIEEVPVVFVDDLTDAQRRMLTHADNQTTLMTGWDLAQLSEELDALSDSFDVATLGFDGPEFEGFDQSFGDISSMFDVVGDCADSEVYAVTFTFPRDEYGDIEEKLKRKEGKKAVMDEIARFARECL